MNLCFVSLARFILQWQGESQITGNIENKRKTNNKVKFHHSTCFIESVRWLASSFLYFNHLLILSGVESVSICAL